MHIILKSPLITQPFSISLSLSLSLSIHCCPVTVRGRCLAVILRKPASRKRDLRGKYRSTAIPGGSLGIYAGFLCSSFYGVYVKRFDLFDQERPFIPETRMMGLSQIKCCLIVVVCFSLFTALSASTFISDGIFGSSVLSERRLLQAKKPCPVNFEFQNYTVITSQCRGPQYPPKSCCAALTEFACPFSDDLNDLTNDCASTMFSYINLYGKYPPGLFASECRGSKQGLECPAPAPGSSQSDTGISKNSGSRVISSFLPVLMLAGASLFSMQFM